MYAPAASKYNAKITHRFLEKGHTQNGADNIHGMIVKRTRGREIYTPDDWKGNIKLAKRTKPEVYFK